MKFRLEDKVFLAICVFIVAGLVGCWQGPVITGPALKTSPAQEAVITAPADETTPQKAAGPEVTYEPWYALGPFYNITFEQVIGPETGPDLTKEYEQDTPFKYRWRLHPEWKDGVGLDLRLPANSSMYFYRIAKASEAGIAEFTVGTGDGLQVWVNKQEVLRRFDVGNPNTELVTANLRKGSNTILLKVYNKDSASELYFEK
jgi:hypothetical protein